MTTRLPLRVEPSPGEWWRGYLLRVAAYYGVHPFNLLGRLHGIDAVERRHLRWSGIAMPDDVARAVAAIVNLSPVEIQGMHLSVFAGSALNFAVRGFEDFDPALAFNVDRLPLGGAGPLVKATRDRFCPMCVHATPGYRAASWRLQVHLVCTRHRLLLKGGEDTAVNAVIDDAVVDSQCEVLQRLTPSEENAAFFEHLHAQLASSNGQWRQNLEQNVLVAPEQVLDTFRLSVERVLTPGYPDYQGLAGWPSGIAARRLRSPDPAVGADVPSDCLPHLLPMHLFSPGLSDLLHRATIRHARAISAVGASMCATGRTLHAAAEGLPSRRRATTSALFLENLIQLEKEGRAEQFWSLCAAAAIELLRKGTNYRRRELVCNDEDLNLVATAAEPSAYVRTVRTWLVDQWACTYTSSNVRPSVLDGTIEHFDGLYGPGMREALERFL